MSEVSEHVGVAPERVWQVVADGWTYASWVVGASRVREVDASWPSVGSRLHHSVGAWPVVVDDVTVVEECEPQRALTIRARVWPMGVARVHFDLQPAGSGTTVRMTEHVVSGPAALLPAALTDPLLHVRNRETLRRLGLLAQRGGSA